VVAFLEPYRACIDEVNIDAAGIGHYLAEHFDDPGYNVNFINIGEASRDTRQFANLNAELYWGLRERFEAGAVAGLNEIADRTPPIVRQYQAENRRLAGQRDWEVDSRHSRAAWLDEPDETLL
jgi:hypothetical protein